MSRPDGGQDEPGAGGGAGADKDGEAKSKNIIRPLVPRANPQEAEERRRRVIRPLAQAEADQQGQKQAKGSVIRPLGGKSNVIRRLEAGSAGPGGRQSGSIIRPLAPLPPTMPGGRDRLTGIIRPLPPLPPLAATSAAEVASRRSDRDARLATILRPLEARTAFPVAPPVALPPVEIPEDLHPTVPLGEAPAMPVFQVVYCRRCDSANRQSLFFCANCGGALPAAVSLYDTLSHEYEEMQSAERPKSEIVPQLVGGRRGPNWQAYGLSDRGRVRKNNEDTVLADPLPGGGWLLLVADGMGGAEAGEVASSQAAAIVRELIANRMSSDSAPETDHRTWLIGAIEQANNILYGQAADDPNLRGMGTTTTAGIIQGLCLELGHAGDSRCYRLPADRPIEQLTNDHAIVAHLVRLGQISEEEAEGHPLRNQLYRAVATAPTIEVDATMHILAPTDRLLFCSDGLTLHLNDQEIETVLRQAATAQEACRNLVALTLKRGAGDNVSVIVLMPS